MTLNSLRSVSCLLLFWLFCYVPAFSQISDGLYKTLPDSLKPKNKTALTVLEKQRIIKNASEYYSATYAAEYEVMVTFLDKTAQQTQDKKLKVETKYILGTYYALLNNNKQSIRYFREAIQDIGDSKDYNHTLAWSYSDLGGQLYLAGYNNAAYKYDSTVTCLHNSLQLGGKDSALLCSNYNLYSVIYYRLLLYKQAIYYGDLSIKFAPSIWKWTANYTSLVLTQGTIYVQSYVVAKKKVYADSASLLLRQVIVAQKNNASQWYAKCYLYLGIIEYTAGKYPQSIALLDSASLPQYNRSVYFGIAYYKAMGLIKLGHFTDGKKILDTLNVSNLELRRNMYLLLYEHAENSHNYKAALGYYKKYKSAMDTLDIEGQKGKVFEVEQKYNVAQKQATIATLENQNLVKEKEKRNLLTGGMLGILALGALGYAANRRQQTKVRKERALLTNNLHRIEEEMNLKIVQQQAESEMVIASQRQDISRDMHDEVSSSLVTLQYYITDLKNEEADVRMKTVLDNIEQETRQVYAQARRFMHRLHNSAVRTQYNILDFLYHLTLGFSKGSSLKIYTDVDEEAVLRYLMPQHHNELYAIIKELVANSLKHSGANRLDIKLWAEQELFQFSVKDNGRGMGTPTEKGLGLDSVAKRLTELNGTIHYDSQSTGTTVTGSFPVIDLYANNEGNVVG